MSASQPTLEAIHVFNKSHAKKVGLSGASGALRNLATGTRSQPATKKLIFVATVALISIFN
jgi:hypothetical protein